MTHARPAIAALALAAACQTARADRVGLLSGDERFDAFFRAVTAVRADQREQRAPETALRERARLLAAEATDLYEALPDLAPAARRDRIARALAEAVAFLGTGSASSTR